MHDRSLVLGRSLMSEGRQLLQRSAVSAPSPRSGEVKRTSLPDTFDGIRYEIGRMVQYVKDSVHDRAVLRQAERIQAERLRNGPSMNGAGLGASDERALKLQAIDEWCRAHFRYVNDPPNIEVIQTPGRMVKQTQVPPEVIQYLMTPFYDAFTQAGIDVSGYVPPATYVGDCVPFSQKVIVQDERGAYKIVPVGDLEHCWKTHRAMSWNAETGKMEPRKLPAFMDIGMLPVYRIQLSNGASFRCTKNHELYVLWRRDYTSEWVMVTMTLEELMVRRANLNRGELVAIPVAREIPEADPAAQPDIPYEQAWVEGLYVAEGWREKPQKPGHNWRARIGMNNPEVIAELKECLDSIGQSYGETARKSDGLVTVGLHVSPFVTRLALEFGENSEFRKFPDSYLSLSLENMRAALEAFAAGDGYYPKSGQWSKSADLIYNTQSETLARQIAFMHLVLGRPLSFYRQPAWKTKPAMFRLYEYKSYKAERVDGFVGSRVVSIESDEPERCCDITVDGNHNFLLESGVLVHNCDEGVTGMTSLCACTFGAGSPSMNGPDDDVRYFFQFGGNQGTLHHVWSKTVMDGMEYHADHTEPGYRLGDHSPFEAYEDVEVVL
jgi:hypothetical protein